MYNVVNATLFIVSALSKARTGAFITGYVIKENNRCYIWIPSLFLNSASALSSRACGKEGSRPTRDIDTVL